MFRIVQTPNNMFYIQQKDFFFWRDLKRVVHTGIEMTYEATEYFSTFEDAHRQIVWMTTPPRKQEKDKVVAQYNRNGNEILID